MSAFASMPCGYRVFGGEHDAIHRSRSQGLAGSGLPREPARPPSKPGRGNNQTRNGDAAMEKAADAAARAAANRADDAGANAHRAHESADRAHKAADDTHRHATELTRSKPKPSTTRPGLSVRTRNRADRPELKPANRDPSSVRVCLPLAWCRWYDLARSRRVQDQFLEPRRRAVDRLARQWHHPASSRGPVTCTRHRRRDPWRHQRSPHSFHLAFQD